MLPTRPGMPRRALKPIITFKLITDLSISTEILIPESEDENIPRPASYLADEEVELSEQTRAVVNALQEGYRLIEKRRGIINEAETRWLLIDPVLRALGFPPSHRKPEDGDRWNRPDEICYDREVDEEIGTAAIVLEAKSLGTEFDTHQQLGQRSSSPDRLIQRYLRQHIASGPATIGILTDGLRWRLYERVGVDVDFMGDYDFATIAKSFWRPESALSAEQISECDQFIALATRCFATPQLLAESQVSAQLEELLQLISSDAPLQKILQRLVSDEDVIPRDDIAEIVSLGGIQEYSYLNDWIDNVYSFGPAIEPEGQLSLSDQITISVLKFKHSETGIGRGDAALCARIFARAAGSRMSVMLIYSVAPDRTVEARLVACAQNNVNMTAPFDPELPLPSARIAISQIIELLSRGTTISADELLEPLDSDGVRQQFYREVIRWTWNLQRGQNFEYRQTVLKHLIRVLFIWILKEDSMVPAELFERRYVDNCLTHIDDYHLEVLRYLFHHRLNRVEDERSAHSIDALNAVLDQAPFLNGSLFAENPDDAELNIPAELYWNTELDNPGLYTILSRYYWTTDEHRPGASEQTLDPELLSNLFEQLITPTEEGKEPPERQPQGTYYTPADIADEMVKDALTAAVRKHAPDNFSDNDLLTLFGDPEAQLPQISDDDRTRLLDRVAELRIFDPSVGSWEFLFSVLIALKTAIEKLNGQHPNTTREIIKKQLAGQDINSLATQITRLRLFIAIKSAERALSSQEPLPNLEARVICADTLETVANPNWQPSRPASLGDSDPEFVMSLAELAENRRRWFDAHHENDKAVVRRIDAELRQKLTSHLTENGNESITSPELRGFVEYQLLSAGAEHAKTDPRLLFYEPEFNGFDIVIGNPPYEALSRSIDAIRKTDLIENKHFKTTSNNNLYTLFCEVGLALAKRNGGVVTMIVPFSIAFGQRQHRLRQLFAEQCGNINLRHYDIRPDTPFNESPTVLTPSNSQRATIFTASIGNEIDPVIRTTGAQRWASADLELCLQQRRTVQIPATVNHPETRISRQWPRIPTSEVAEMVRVMCEQEHSISDFITPQGDELAVPRTARYFLTCVPKGLIESRGESLFAISDETAFKLAIATVNGHVGYAWWRIFSDTFHVNLHEITSIPIPNLWINQPDAPIMLADALLKSVPDCAVETLRSGRTWRNANFHLKPNLIEELDRLHIRALGLDVEPLLTHLKIMRSSSSWNFD